LVHIKTKVISNDELNVTEVMYSNDRYVMTRLNVNEVNMILGME